MNTFVIFLSIFFKSVLCDLTLPLPPRYMWGWGPGLSGYCGEMSTQVNPISSHLHTVLFHPKNSQLDFISEIIYLKSKCDMLGGMMKF
jgi:hypothetical protein